MNLANQAHPRPSAAHPLGRTHQARVIRYPSHAARSDCAGRMVVSGRIDQVCKALQDMLAQAH